MKNIRPEDLTALNDVIIELPAFVDLKSKDDIKKVLDLFLEDIYTARPAELLETFNYHLSEKMQNTFFKNYGIDDDYANNLMGYVKPDIAFELEKLFQNKGSNTIFKMLANLLESIFPRMNFYNIEVHKYAANTKTGYDFKYGLKPIFIQDESVLIKEPELDVVKQRKYLMDLKNFEEYTIWPVPTNLMYIQFSIGTDLINNLNTFLDGIRSYATNYLSGLYFNYLSDSGVEEDIEASDLELLIMYFQLNLMKFDHSDPNLFPDIIGSQLSVFQSKEFDKLDTETEASYQSRLKILNEKKCSIMQTLALLFYDYQKADYSDRNDMDNLRRRWQFFLNQQTSTDVCFTTIGEINQLVESRYPMLYEDYNKYLLKNMTGDKEGICDFFIKMYSVFIAGANSSFAQAGNKKCFIEHQQPMLINIYTWRNQAGDTLSNAKEFSYTPTKVGSETLTLTVENQSGYAGSDTVTLLTTKDGEPAPSVSIDKNRIVEVYSRVNIIARAETIQGETIVGYEWKLDDKIIKSSETETTPFIPTTIKKFQMVFDASEIKDYILELKIWDSLGKANYNSVRVRVIGDEAPEEYFPKAYAGPNLRAVLNEPIQIIGSGEDMEFIKIHDQEWVMTYIDVMFGNLFLSDAFITHFFTPIMDLFQKYFFPVELEYLVDLVNRIKIKDKWNSVSTKTVVNTRVNINRTSLMTPIRGLDQTFFKLLTRKHSYIDKKDSVTISDYPVKPRP